MIADLRASDVNWYKCFIHLTAGDFCGILWVARLA
jgi:hypothetical protein